MTAAFDELQAQLGPALAANRPGSGIDHVMIALPSYSVSESLMSHYGDRIAALEHRYLNAVAVAGRIESCEIVYISTRAPLPEIVRYYLDLLPDDRRESAAQRIRMVEVPDDGTPRSVAARMVDRPDLIQLVREHIGDRPAFIEPWTSPSTR